MGRAARQPRIATGAAQCVLKAKVSYKMALNFNSARYEPMKNRAVEASRIDKGGKLFTVTHKILTYLK